MLPNVGDYMSRPAFSPLSSQLAKLSPREQERMLEQTYLEQSVAPTLRQDEATISKHVPNINPTSELQLSGRTQHLHWPHQLAFHSARSISHRASNLLGNDAPEENLLQGLLSPLFEVEKGEREDALPCVKWEDIAQSSHSVLVIGTPGMGKTTFLRGLERTYAIKQKTRDRDDYPVYVPLRQLSATIANLASEIRQWLPTSPRANSFVFLLDGFDEVPLELRKHMAHGISGLRDHYPNSRIVVTTRPTHNLDAFQNMTRCRMQPATDSKLFMWACYQVSSMVAKNRDRWDDALLQYSFRFRERPDMFRDLSSPLLLSHSARLFADKSVTAYHDAELLDACLTLLLEQWDEQKSLVRFKKSWARPRKLYQWLSMVCYHTLIQQNADFTSRDVAMWLRDIGDAPSADDILQALAESTGLIQEASNGQWTITHKTFQEYLAAKYVVDSSRSATDYFNDFRKEPRMPKVLRFACSMTHDATPLFEFALNTHWTRQDDQITTLADILAQPCSVDRSVVERCCDSVVGWLDKAFDGWVSTTADDIDAIQEPKWQFAARRTWTGRSNNTSDGRSLLHVLRAIHRARSGSTKEPLAQRLNASEQGAVRSIGSSLEADGFMQGYTSLQEGSDVIMAQVAEI